MPTASAVSLARRIGLLSRRVTPFSGETRSGRLRLPEPAIGEAVSRLRGERLGAGVRV